MKSPELQALTASEPLSLEEEYAMQKAWRNDEDKCTFLILSKAMFEETKDEIKSLIGDTNLFFNTNISDVDDEDLNVSYNTKNIAEAEIMIAETEYRGKKLGWEAMLLMLKYGQSVLNIQKFLVKINKNNRKSISMFEKMQFVEVSVSEIFNEVTLERNVDPDWIIWLDHQVILNIENYIL